MTWDEWLATTVSVILAALVLIIGYAFGLPIWLATLIAATVGATLAAFATRKGRR